MIRRSLFSLIPFATALLAAASASAKGSENGGAAAEHHEAHFSDINWFGIGADHSDAPALGFVFVTFAVFAGALVFLIRPKLVVLLENRSDDVKKAIDEAKRAKDAAEARARDAEEKLANLANEMTRLKQDFEAQGKIEMERIEKMAHQTAARIAKDAEDTIAAEAVRAQHTLRAEAARLALELAEERIKGALSKEDDVRLHGSLLNGLEKGNDVNSKRSSPGTGN